MKNLSSFLLSVLAQTLLFGGLVASQCLPLFWTISMPAIYWWKQGILLGMWIVVFYIVLLYLIPILFRRNRSGLFLLSILGLVTAFLVMNYWIDEWIGIEQSMNRHFKVKNVKSGLGAHLFGYLWLLLLTLIVVGSAVIIASVKKMRTDALLRENLEREKLQSELSFLKAQVNPHFFFNVLNSIYALTGENEPAQQAVYHLSRMMRHVLYGTKAHTTSLSKEVLFLEDYLKLMDLRLTPNVQVIFEKSNRLHAEVMPMLFLPFIENAFKHGVSSVLPSYVYIKLEQQENVLEFTVRNPILPMQPGDKEESNGIGLVNSKRRLDLIYPQKHVLTAEANSDNSEFAVYLKLIL